MLSVVMFVAGAALLQSPAPGPETPPAAPPVEPAPPPAVVTDEPVNTLAADSAAEALAFGDHLFEDGDYYRAVTEYRRYLFKTRGLGTDASRVALAIGEAYLRGAQYEAAAQQFDTVADRPGDDGGRAVASISSARAYLLDDRPLLARPRARRIFQDDAMHPSLRSEAGMLLALSYVQGENYGKARSLLMDSKLLNGQRAPLAKALLKALQDRENLPQKNPLLAFVLALVPGMGHFYLGQWAVGITALLWNGLFIAGALDAWIQRSWGVAIILTLLELTFYAGSVFGAVSGAFKYNRDQELNWRDQVRAQYEGVLRLQDPLAGTAPGSLVRFGVPVEMPVPK